MAEFALGLTKTAVAGTVSRVKSAIEEEAEIKERVQNDLVFITEEFEMMQSFLNAAHAGEHAAKNHVVRSWVRQLRRLAFEVEDCVDFVLHLEPPRWTNWLWRVVPSCIAPPLPMDQAVAEIQRLKARVADVSQRNTRYNLMVGGTTSSTADQQLIMLPPPTSSINATSTAAFDVLIEVWKAAGNLRTTGGTHLKELISSTDGDNRLQVVSLWTSPGPGPGGAAHHLGASHSHFIREVYHDPEICQEFTTRAWVKLTPMLAFNPDEFLNGLLAQFYQLPATAATASNTHKAKLLQQFNTNRYLLVLQGVSSVVDWDAIRTYLPDNNNGSRIVVSTHHFRIALLCTGDPYQVSLLTRFSDGQSICAFSKSSVLRSDMGELNWQIRRGGVISLLGDARTDRMRQLYKGIMHKRKEFDGVVEFKEQSWVDVPDPFNLEAFCVRLFLDFQSRDFQAKEIGAVGMMGPNALAERCLEYLREDDCLLVINGLQSKEHWDEINKTFLLSGPPTTKGTSIIVITEEEGVAKHCVDHQQHRVIDSNSVDMAHDGLMKDYRCCGIGKEDSRRAHLLFHDPHEAYYWVNNFKLDGRRNEVATIHEEIRDPGVISVWGHSGVGKSVIVKKVYYEQMYERRQLFECFSFVDVPDRDPFDLTDFSWHLLLDFYSRNPLPKQNVVISLFHGRQDPIQACCWFLQQTKCLVVIDGLRSEGDWDKIRDTFLSSDQPTRGCIVVITNEENVARHCAVDDRVLGVKRLRVFRHRPLTEDPPGRFLYDREEEAHTSWANEFHLVGRREDSSLFDTLIREDVLIRGGVFSVWGVAGVGKSALIRDYFRRNQGCICVDVPVPFHLTEFSWRLLLGFHSNDLQAKEIAAIGVMEGQDTVHKCSEIIRDNPCFLVIDGLRSTHDWDLIRASFLPEHTDQRKAIIVISNEASVAKHCASHDKSRVLNVKGLNAADSFRLFRKVTELTALLGTMWRPFEIKIKGHHKIKLPIYLCLLSPDPYENRGPVALC